MNGVTDRRGDTRMIGLTAFMTATCAGLAVLIVSAGGDGNVARASAADQARDTRQAVRLTAAEVNAVRAEMRQMLVSINGIVVGVASDDAPAIQKAAKASGMAAAVDPKLEKKLPRHFLELGERTHEGFDRIAAGAGSGAAKADVLKQVGDVTASCVACHATYRLAPTR